MAHIFRFHKGRNNNIIDWRASDKIQPGDVGEVLDKTNVLSSAAGTSIPTPIARMYLFKTAFEIVAAQIRRNALESHSIYAGLVSETLDLLELLYKCGSDSNRFRFQRWSFDNSQHDDHAVLQFFGHQHGHRLLAQSFKQAAAQSPFDNKIEIILIYYRENNTEILLGGTSPFTFVFTTPNFKRKFRERGFRPINGMTLEDVLFSPNYKQLHERDESFIKYIESLATSQQKPSFSGFAEYVENERNRYYQKFNGTIASLQDIQFDDMPLSICNINLKQITEEDYRQRINQYSDFKMSLPADTSYTGTLTPLFLLHEMAYDGNYTSPTSRWSPTTRVSEIEYPEAQYPITRLDDIMMRELPGLDGLNYPFLSSFDFFERCLIKLPEYELNEERFITLTAKQGFLYPIKPIFFHFFPISRIADYVSIETGRDQDRNDTITVILRIPITGATIRNREFVCRRTYGTESRENRIYPIITYSGILGIYPFTKTKQSALAHLNKYTVASYEKTNVPTQLESIRFLKNTAIEPVHANPVARSEYKSANTKTSYYLVPESFDIIQLNFLRNDSNCGGLILPRFKEVSNGREEYIYAIDFGTSNTHVEYGRVYNGSVTDTAAFSIDERSMQMYLLNKPKLTNSDSGSERYNDYERSMGGTVDAARTVTLREFVPFQIGTQKSASVKFPFRTATYESDNFLNNYANNRLFLDANIGFNLDEDILADYTKYTTNLKWLLEMSANDQFNINRVSMFFRQLLLMIRTKILLEPENPGDITRLKIAVSFPISMGNDLKNKILGIVNTQKDEILGSNSIGLKEVTESIAPYYQLRYENTNIQNDSYCNIDIGGGTTDVVLINQNTSDLKELFCFCTSFRFAGKELWSSGDNQFQIMNNGFVEYYKHFIEQNHPKLYSLLSRLLNSKNNRTEDVVSFLFNKPEYKFGDIFSENKDLKTVLVIHYCAILFYVTRYAQKNNVDLPRTVSFSGKGSEYLSFIFPSNNDLKGFTQKMLSIFSGQQVRSDFVLERSREPKVITAKGSVHYANEKIYQNDDNWALNIKSESQEKRLTLKEVGYKGFKDFSNEEKAVVYGDLLQNNDLFADLINNVADFLRLLFDNSELCELISKRLQIKDFARHKDFFIPKNVNIVNEGNLRDSLKSVLIGLNPTDKISDTPFFFPLNQLLIKFSKHIVSSSINPQKQ
jgi:hypothetical protein